MAKRDVLGAMQCPECGLAGAQIKAQKNGLLYRWCADGCNAQFFARNPEQEAAMRSKVGAGVAAVPVTVTAPKPEPARPAPKAPEPTPAPEPKPKPKPKGTGNALLDLIQGAA